MVMLAAETNKPPNHSGLLIHMKSKKDVPKQWKPIHIFNCLSFHFISHTSPKGHAESDLRSKQPEGNELGDSPMRVSYTRFLCQACQGSSLGH